MTLLHIDKLPPAKYPRFGYAYPALNIIQIKEDLPKAAKAFVVAHEIYHLTDPSKNWIVREFKANLWAAFAPLIGGLMVVGMSLFSPARLKFYYRKLRS